MSKQSINIEVPVDQIDVIFKAAEMKLKHDHAGETDPHPSPASKKLLEIVSETYDAMTNSMVKEISELLGAK